jgi:hypothetical protein
MTMHAQVRAPEKRRNSAGAQRKKFSLRALNRHADEAFDYFRRVRHRLYRDRRYRGRYVAIRDRKIVDVADDKFALYYKLLERFPDHRFIVSQVLAELPTIDAPSS